MLDFTSLPPEAIYQIFKHFEKEREKFKLLLLNHRHRNYFTYLKMEYLREKAKFPREEVYENMHGIPLHLMDQEISANWDALLSMQYRVWPEKIPRQEGPESKGIIFLKWFIHIMVVTFSSDNRRS